MANKKNEDAIAHIKKLVGTGKLIIGTDKTLKGLKAGTIERVYLSKNCPEETTDQLERYSKIASVEIIRLERLNENMGTVCKKQYSVSVIGVAKE